MCFLTVCSLALADYELLFTQFEKSIEVKVTLPKWVGPKGFCVWSIIRGQENVPVSVGGHQLPPSARLRTHGNHELFINDQAFTPLANKTGGSGVIVSSTYGIAMGVNPHINPPRIP